MYDIRFLCVLFALRTSIMDTHVFHHFKSGRNILQFLTDNFFSYHFQVGATDRAKLVFFRKRYFNPFDRKILCLFLECCLWFSDVGFHRYFCSRQDGRFLLFRFIKEGKLSIGFGRMLFAGSAKEFSLHIFQLLVQKLDLNRQFSHLIVAVFQCSAKCFIHLSLF